MNNQQIAQGLGLDQNKNKTGEQQDVSKPQKSSAKIEIRNTGPTQFRLPYTHLTASILQTRDPANLL